MWEYTDRVKDHFLNPRNVGEIENPDGVGEVGSMACGDALKLFFKLDADGKIADARFQTFGCASAIASSSALTEMLKGKTIDEAEKITNEDIAAYLGGLPKEKMHCSVLGRDALKKAVMNYRRRSDSVDDGSDGHLCIFRISLHFRVAGTLPCAKSHGRAVHGGPRIHPVQPEYIQYRRRN
jgi:NifU-like protein